MSFPKKTVALHHAGRDLKTHARNTSSKKVSQGVPLIVFYWTLGLGLISYVVSRFIFTTHPLHWLTGLGGLLLGVIIGYIWFYTRGDVGLL